MVSFCAEFNSASNGPGLEPIGPWEVVFSESNRSKSQNDQKLKCLKGCILDVYFTQNSMLIPNIQLVLQMSYTPSDLEGRGQVVNFWTTVGVHILWVH